MKITPDHWLEGATRELLPGGGPMNMRRFLIIHFTAGMSARSSLEFWRSPEAKGASAHLLIDRDGSILQCRPFNVTCGHAGRSKWRGFEGLNCCSIGIELANAGDSVSLVGGVPKAFAKYDCPAGALKARHRKGGPEVWWENYPDAQVAACQEASKLLCERYSLDDVVGHEDIAPERKNDPGPAFPLVALREHCGFQGWPSANAER